MALPSGYTQLQHIESTGTQHINTDFVPNQDTRVVCDAQFTDISGTVTILGQRYTSAAQKSFTWISISGNLRSYYHSYYGVVATSDKSRHVYELDKNKTIIDGNTVRTWSYASFTADFPIFIFANNEQGTASFHAKMKLYACQIYDNGTLVRDYVPAMRNADGAIGLYDQKNGVFYTNAGSGAFEHGGPIGPAGSRVLIDGVGYRMKCGTGLVGGVLYGIKLGKVMESGAVYDILLDPAAAEPNTLTATIEVEGGMTYDSVTINGVSYNTAQTIAVEPGTVATFKLHYALFENGNQLYYYTGATYGTYAYTINTDIQIKFTSGHTYIYR